MATATTSLEIAVPAKTVWEALTNKDKMSVWYFDIPDFSTTPGTTFEFYESEEKQYLHRCEVLECVEGKLFKHTWQHPNESEGTSVVTWTLDEKDGVTTVMLTHSGLENFADGGDALKPENYQMGWDAIVKTNLRNFLVGIERLVFEVEIKAPTSRIWNSLWDHENYKVWTMPFCEGSYYTGKIKPGERIHFLMPKGDGMYSNVLMMNENENVIFQHIGELKDFREQELDDAAKQWTGCFEMYTLTEQGGGKVRLTAEVDCTKEHINYMKEKFPLGLNEVKRLSEN